MKFFKNMSAQWGLTEKLAALFILFGFVPMAIIGTIAYNASLTIEGTSGTRFQNVAEGVADRIDRNLFERYGDVQAFGINRAIDQKASWYRTEEQSNPLIEVMNQYVDTYDLYYLTILVDLDGRVIAVNSKDADGKPIQSQALYRNNYRETAWFRALKAQQFTTTMPFSAPGNTTMTGTYIEDLHVDSDVRAAYPGDDSLTLGFSAPVYRDGKVVAYWTNRTKFSLVEDILQASQKVMRGGGFSSAALVLLDKDGKILVDYEPSETGTDQIQHDFTTLMATNLADRGLMAAKGAVAGKTSFVNDPHHRTGSLRMFGYTHLKGALGYPGMNWSVLVSIDHASATADARAINRNVLIAGIACLAIILPIGIVIGRIGVRGVLRVGEAAVKLSGGALDTRVAVTSTDEIGQLAQSFNSMAEQIQRNVAQQEAAHQALQAPLRDVKIVLGALAQGDLTPRMTGTYQAEFEEMKQNMNSAMEKLAQTLLAVRESAQTVTVGCEEISRRNEVLAERTSGQAAALEETAASMEEMTATVKQSADSAAQAKQLAADASVMVENGSRLASEVRTSMETVAASTQKVAGITKLIDDIATQTNKLAVDAGVGASRASAQGRGFGIVAQEVRSLAQRSATAVQQIKGLIGEFRAKVLDRRAGDDSRSDALQSDVVTSVNKIADIAGMIDEIALQTNMLAINAAVEAAGAGAHGQNFSAVVTEIRDLAARSAAAGREITGLITASLQHIEKGNALSSQSAKTLQDIEQAVTTVSRVVGQIAAASQEQAKGIEQVNKAVSQMDQTTQQNAALVEEATSSGQHMTTQAKELMRQFESFKVDVSEGQKAAMPSVAQIRDDHAISVHNVYGELEQGAVPSPKPVSKLQARNVVASSKAEIHDEPVGVDAGNGKDRRSKEAEFEEF